LTYIRYETIAVRAKRARARARERERERERERTGTGAREREISVGAQSLASLRISYGGIKEHACHIAASRDADCNCRDSDKKAR